jgi:DNA-binding NtrC family response regulator
MEHGPTNPRWIFSLTVTRVWYALLPTWGCAVDGIQVLDRTVHLNAATPVIIITGKPSEHTEDHYLRRGALGFFRKPVDGDALLDLLDGIA